MPGDTETVLVVGSGANDMTLGRMCERAFESLGYNTIFFDERVPRVPFFGWRVGTGRLQKRLVSRCQDAVPDIVLVIKGENLHRETIAEIREIGATVCNWNPDNPFQARGADRRMDRFLKTLDAYDEVFIWSNELFDPLRNAGARSVHELPFGFDPERHYPADPDTEQAADVVFAGQWSEKRQTLLAAILELNVDLAVYGNGWRKNCFDRKLRDAHRGAAVYGEAYSRLFSSSTICLNIVADHNLEAYNMRSFEIPATDSFMLTSRTSKQCSIFGENEGIACFDSPNELRKQVTYYLDADAERKAIAHAGYETVQSHSYRDRMATVADVALDEGVNGR